jgi:GxxExxY protein
VDAEISLLMKTKSELNELSGIIVDAAIEVHRELGPGLLERVYEASLAKELRLRGISSVRQLPQPVIYKGEELEDEGYKIDLLVEDCIIVELKTVSELLPIHHSQLLTYLRPSEKKLGLLINFHVPLLKNGIKRLVHDFPSE